MASAEPVGCSVLGGGLVPTLRSSNGGGLAFGVRASSSPLPPWTLETGLRRAMACWSPPELVIWRKVTNQRLISA